jgi:glycosyltransferase involved in cell wall biosynthesis
MSKHGRKCTLIVPVRNEAKNLVSLVNEIPEFIDQVIMVVDASSTDDSLKVANAIERVASVVIQTGKGKGSALSQGFAAVDEGLIFTIDSDGSMTPSEIDLLADALIGGCSIVKGSRNLAGAGSDDITRFRNVGNNLLTKISNKLFDGSSTDATYGFWGFTKEALDSLELSNVHKKISGKFSHRSMAYGQGFEIELLMLCRARRRGIQVCEVPSYERNRWSGSSNLRAITDGLRSLFAIIFERLRSSRKFT